MVRVRPQQDRHDIPRGVRIAQVEEQFGELQSGTVETGIQTQGIDEFTLRTRTISNLLQAKPKIGMRGGIVGLQRKRLLEVAHRLVPLFAQ